MALSNPCTCRQPMDWQPPRSVTIIIIVTQTALVEENTLTAIVLEGTLTAIVLEA
jgi:hypothetical protein